MPTRTLPNTGVISEQDDGSSGWGSDYRGNHRIFDALIQAAVEEARATPPGAPSEGQRYLVASSATGAWTGRTDQIAAWYDGAWRFLAPREGWVVYNRATDTFLFWSGSAWGVFPGTPIAASVADKTFTRYAVQTPNTDVPVGSGSAVQYQDFLLPNRTAQFHLTGMIYAQQFASAANAVKVVARLTNSAGTILTAWDFIGIAPVVAPSIVSASFSVAGEVPDINEARIRILAYRDAPQGDVLLLNRIHSSLYGVTR